MVCSFQRLDEYLCVWLLTKFQHCCSGNRKMSRNASRVPSSDPLYLIQLVTLLTTCDDLTEVLHDYFSHCTAATLLLTPCPGFGRPGLWALL